MCGVTAWCLLFVGVVLMVEGRKKKGSQEMQFFGVSFQNFTYCQATLCSHMHAKAHFTTYVYVIRWNPRETALPSTMHSKRELSILGDYCRPLSGVERYQVIAICWHTSKPHGTTERSPSCSMPTKSTVQ